jgi:hypothetical protein
MSREHGNSNRPVRSVVGCAAVGVRSYISEPDRGRRHWTKNPQARDAVYRNRRRIAVRGACACCDSAASAWSGPSRISTRRAASVARLSSRSHQHSQATADSRGRLQSRSAHAPVDRCRHATRAAGAPRGGPRGASDADSDTLRHDHVSSVAPTALFKARTSVHRERTGRAERRVRTGFHHGCKGR